MSSVQKLAGLLVLAGLLIAAGAGVGAWLAAGHYRALLDAAQDDLATTKAGRDHLEELAGEQGRKLGDLVLAGRGREQRAAQAQADARELAQGEYAAANRLLQERTGGDQCAAATAVIDQELGL
ncbi:hypothetical protein C1Y35_19620 [Pseudomonas sp. GW456-L14]|uniref:hypothetical protein n=1 Tax=unclassified Pseudomonas TaxID=196821 RepID=UPI000C88EB26|nr:MULTISPECIES: hypothetical protein [unclassified Pseudomonas]PMY37299.1 hypothetical protein C1Y35_19620 [Pseudomonas sp. GW456-L14]PMY59384.1 hypothetical protein C1Y34_02350 [Pseudomonas sp. GW456-L12]